MPARWPAHTKYTLSVRLYTANPPVCLPSDLHTQNIPSLSDEQLSIRYTVNTPVCLPSDLHTQNIPSPSDIQQTQQYACEVTCTHKIYPLHHICSKHTRMLTSYIHKTHSLHQKFECFPDDDRTDLSLPQKKSYFVCYKICVYAHACVRAWWTQECVSVCAWLCVCMCVTWFT